MQSISISDLRNDFSSILKSVQSTGEQYIIESGNEHQKIAIIIPYDETYVKQESRKFGICKDSGSFTLHDDFEMTTEELLGL